MNQETDIKIEAILLTIALILVIVFAYMKWDVEKSKEIEQDNRVELKVISEDTWTRVGADKMSMCYNETHHLRQSVDFNDIIINDTYVYEYYCDGRRIIVHHRVIDIADDWVILKGDCNCKAEAIPREDVIAHVVEILTDEEYNEMQGE